MNRIFIQWNTYGICVKIRGRMFVFEYYILTVVGIDSEIFNGGYTHIGYFYLPSRKLENIAK